MHGVTEAQRNAGFKEILNEARMVVPDWYQLPWLGRRKGLAQMKRRVYGPELMAAFANRRRGSAIGTSSMGERPVSQWSWQASWQHGIPGRQWQESTLLFVR
jgi:UDP-N-acetyl-D-mannosaminuronic acid transferase (WecB/TagA/CpsF family)